ncbi:MAG: TVP38/TMEM64 family protein [Deltaproteobacteria bacterium]|nr:TVP38/TMEM64 family protein [Deltaproteobacteria bacterium]
MRRAVVEALKVTLLVFLAIGATIVVRATPLGEDFDRSLGEIARLRGRWWAIPAFAGCYILAIAMGLPGTLLTFLGGAAFGFWQGLLVNWVSASLGAGVAFWEARFLGQAAATRILRDLHLSGLEEPKTAFVRFVQLRLIPVIPFGPVNFAAGLTNAPFLPFLLGTAIGILPSTIAWTYLAVAVPQGSDELRAVIPRIGIALGVLALFSLVPRWVERWKRRRP